jgi:general secretion pathway protein C
MGDCLPADKQPNPPPCQSGQGTLTAVQQTRISVLYQGQNLAFDLKKRTASGSTGAATPSVDVRRPVQVEESSTAQTGAGAFPAVRNGSNIEIRVPGPEVEKAFENFADVIKQARVIPHSVNGAPAGFRILRIQNQSIFQRLGLANNDIIQRVNGESLASADQALRLFTLFQNEREIVLDIQRSNEDLTLSYIIE